ncbi:MAG TPA: thiamine pyrophosphate-dependent dehydrogenase E1 component subunit alpha [Burkholderiaceae bacterium]|nr:thiamine pyrophosphate-dependent dehydrogenase E1 component subunit alpha [Burkholderiaceae bacterium]
MAGGNDPADRVGRLRALYTTMARIRAFEDAAEIASQGGVSAWGLEASGTPARVRGPLHLSTGQEAVAVGVCANLRRDDLLTSTHRGHGHTLAKGADMTAMMCELFGRASGTNGGKGGSMHIADFSVGMLGANGVVAAGIPIATGAAHALKLAHSDRIVCCFFGDGAINRGPFLEGLNWAQVYRLPVLFVCEDNRIAATTPTATMTAGEGAAARARAFGILTLTVDGNDVEAVAAAAAELTGQVRGGAPALLHAITYRFKGHVSVDPARYRDAAEVERARQDDPLARARQRLDALGLGDEAGRILDAARTEVQAALATADAAPFPDASCAYTDVLDTGAGRWT